MTSKCCWSETFFGMQAPYPYGQIFRGCQEESRIARPGDVLDRIVVTRMRMMPHKGRKFELTFGAGIRCRGRVPDFNESTCTNGKVATRGREFQGRDTGFEGEVVQDYSSGKVCEYGSAIFVDGKEEVASRIEGKPGNVATMCGG